MYFIPESCSHDTLLTAFHGFIRVFKYGIGTYLNKGNLLNMIIYLSYGDENHCKLVKCTCASSEMMSFE